MTKISKRDGSPDPDPHENVMDREHCTKQNSPIRFNLCTYLRVKTFV